MNEIYQLTYSYYDGKMANNYILRTKTTPHWNGPDGEVYLTNIEFRILLSTTFTNKNMVG